MNSQEYRNLQEAYLNVYQEEVLDEVRGGGEIDPVSDIPGIGLRGARSPKDAGLQMSPLKRAQLRKTALEKRGTPEATKRANRIDSRFVRPTVKAVNRSLLAATNARHTEKKRLMNPQESYDLYDVILSHLLDEGYADTNENALVIMANMSEDWKQSILTEVSQEDGRDQGMLKKQKKSITKLNSKQAGSGEKDEYHQRDAFDDNDDSDNYYPTVPTDHRARKRRASGR